MAHDLNVLALIKGAERFVFVYDEPRRDELMGTLQELAGDPESPLTWFAALVLTKKVREQAAEVTADELP